MFVCNVCGKEIPCSCNLKYVDNILQLTSLKDIDLDSDDKYIGYENIGEFYSSSKYELDESNILIAEEIKKHVSNILDLGCGDGVYTIPLLKSGVCVIAGDISNKMMKILSDKIDYFNLDKSLVTLVRMNAYNIPIISNSLDGVIANSLLHLTSNPEKIIEEIHRVLKPNGIYFCFEDAPGNSIKSSFDNHLFNKQTNRFYNLYWEYLKEYNINPVKYSWKFDRNTICNKLFSNSFELVVNISNKYKKTNFYKGFYRRMKGKGFSDQVNVGLDIHLEVFKKVEEQMILEFGDKFLDVEFEYFETDKIIKMYIK